MLDELFIQKCREAFNTFDADGSGSIDAQEMRSLLEAIGVNPSEEELFRFMSEVDEDGTGEIEFGEFLRAFEKQRNGQNSGHSELDISKYSLIILSISVDAFVALGGNRDKSGVIDAQRLARLVRDDFQMTYKTERLIDMITKDKDGRISFSDFVGIFI